MIKKCKFFIIIMLGLVFINSRGQELYVSTEPASNMPARSLGFRLNGQYMSKNFFGTKNITRLNPEFMIGVSKSSMVHFNIYGSNFYRFYANQPSYNFEGLSLYYKWRFFSIDRDHNHFRLAAYSKIAYSKNPTLYQELNLAGDNTGIMVGVIATKLINKLAISAGIGSISIKKNSKNILTNNNKDQWLFQINPLDFNVPNISNSTLISNLSFGLLTLPIHYKNYNQPNLNLYAEFIGQYDPHQKLGYVDIAPAVQLILKSFIRLELAYRQQIRGNLFRIDNSSLNAKIEVNFFNVW